MTTLEKMKSLEKLQDCRGKLLLLKTQLYWFNGGWDMKPNQVYLILDAEPPAESASTLPANYAVRAHHAATEHVLVTEDHTMPTPSASVLLFVDDQQLWFSVCVQDIEVISSEDSDTSSDVINEAV